MTRLHDTHAGQSVYTPLTLAAYDAFVLGFSNRFLWRCPAHVLEELYAANVSLRHLDIGVGTGYFLDKTPWPSGTPSITLADLNPHSLAAAARRIVRLKPTTVQANAFEPLPLDGPFDSVGVCYLLHCLPGTMRDKGVVFDHIRPKLAAHGRVFGATIVQGDAPRSRAAQMLMDFYNRKGIFSNASDTAHGLETELRVRFSHVDISTRGAVALFVARP